MASSQSSSSSIRPQAGLNEGDQQSLPQVETLISYLLGAKRSLSSITHVWRANEIVTASHSALEKSVVLCSRTGFLRRGLNGQLRLLYDVRTEVEQISYRGRDEFSMALKNLDAADARLRNTIDLLRGTIVHASFRPGDEEQKSLHDFVDERGVEELHASLKASIDRTNTARAELDTSNREFDDELQATRQSLRHYHTATKLASSRLSITSSSSSASDSGLLTLSSMPGQIQSLEAHAQEMAILLEALVRHFDLCVTAVKHTDGGGAVARSITGDMPTVVDGSNDGMPNIGAEINANLNAPLDPMTDAEYQEMVAVLIKDAPEADDVVMEIQDRINEMESIFEQVQAQRDALLSISKATIEVHSHLSSLASSRLPRYISQAHNFTRVWLEENDRINSGLAELSDLHSLYDGFLNAYDSLMLEVARRRHVRQRVEKVLRDTRHKLDQLHDEDAAARDTFRVEQGDFLPSDIWPGVGLAPMQVQFLRLSGGPLDNDPVAQNALEEPSVHEYTGAVKPRVSDGSAEGEQIPDLPRDLIEEAYARVKARNKVASQMHTA
ncbi:Autophagy-related protein 17 [Penicillium samsonianum]|uniref:Autophagy-related protein 17 n=1 Tax=Penicillium samsonianum TaxID=1882272 RepID=UPI0025483D68|nr:Autophagy-related protein 17 [Penicillium samsonianum]KAJ6138883.1 Autophagy-related protein 17 [Penicillium samsonianum]